MKSRCLLSLSISSLPRRHAMRTIGWASFVTLKLGIDLASAATWASSKTGNWDDISVNGWNAAYPNALGAVASYDNTNATAAAQVTQNVVAGVSVGSFSMIGTTATATAGRSWTIVPTNAITLNQDGVGGSPATITFSATSNNANDRLVFNAGTLTLADDLVVSKVSTTSIVANALQISSTIGGTGTLTLENVSAGTGNGNILLSPPAGNSFTGSVLVRKGAVTFNHKDAFGNAANTVTLGESGQGNATLIATAALGTVPNSIISAAGAGTLTFGSNSTSTTANTTFSGTVTLNGLLTLTSSSPGSQPVTFTNVISGSGGLAKVGTGSTNLNGANNYTGGTTITAGTLAIGSVGTLGNNVIGNDITINGGNLLLSSASNLGNNQNILYTAGGIGVNFTPGATIPVTDNSASGGVFGINYTGTGGVTSLATLYNGRWSLGSFTGGTYDGATLGAGKDSATEDINTYRLGGGGGTLTVINNVLTGANVLKITGSGGGRVNLPAANSFTGSTTVENGTIGVSAVGNVGSGNSSLGNPALAASAILLGSGTNAVGIDYTGVTPAISDRVLTFAGTTGTVTISNSGTALIAWTSTPTFTGAGARIIQLGNNGDAVGGSIVNLGDDGANKTSVTKAGLSNSTWKLTGNTHTATTRIDGGVLDVTLASLAGSFINLDGDDATHHGVLQTSGTLARLQSATVDPANIKVGGNSGFAAKGGNLTVTLSGGAPLSWAVNNFLAIGGARFVFGSTTANGKVTFTNDINLNTADAAQRPIFVEQGAGGDSAELTGVLSPGTTTVAPIGPSLSGISKIGNGTLILSGPNTYLGATGVTAGKLLVNGNQSTATGLVTVSSGATLGGTGTLGGAVAINAGGQVEFNISTAAAGHDKLDALGVMTFAGASTLTITSVSGATPGLYTLVTASNMVGAVPATLNLPSGWAATVQKSLDGKSLELNVTSTGSALTPYQQWAAGSPYNLLGDDALPGADPDKDGVKNLLEFALNSSPTSGSSLGLVFGKLATVGGDANVQTLTLATRNGSAFSAVSNKQISAVVDGVTYTVEASNILSDWGGPVVTPVTGVDATTIQTGLPAPEAGWSYKTFRTDGSASSDPSDFIRVGVE